MCLIGVVERVGEWTLARWSHGAALATLAGLTVLRVAPALRGKLRAHSGDLFDFVYSTSAVALPLVALINILLGVIVAFIGAVRVWRLGTGPYANTLIGVAEACEVARKVCDPLSGVQLGTEKSSGRIRPLAECDEPTKVSIDTIV